MRWPIYFFGLIMLVMGGSIVINPEITRKMIDYIDGIKGRLYSVGVLSFILGALLLLSSQHSRLETFVMTLGVLVTLDGITVFAVPHNSLIKAVAWYRERSLVAYRVIGIALLVVASVLLFAC